MLLHLGLFACFFLGLCYLSHLSCTIDCVLKSVGFVGLVVYMAQKLATATGRKVYTKRWSWFDKAVFITGCDSGFGNLLAKALDDKGYQVFAGCLFPEGEGAKHLKSSASSKLHIVGVNVTKDDSVKNAVEEVRNNLNGRSLTTVVANAGIISVGELEWVKTEDMHKLFDVNVYGVARTVQAFLPLLRESKMSKRIVVTTSLWGRMAFPVTGAYCMTKAAAIVYTDTLRREVHKFGIEVVAIEPNIYRTPLVDKETLARSVQKTWDQTSEVVKKDYTTRYFEETKDNMRFLLESEGRTQVNEVVDDMVDAVTTVRPSFFYRPDHPVRKLFYTFLTSAPAQAVDLFLENRKVAKSFRKYSNMW